MNFHNIIMTAFTITTLSSLGATAHAEESTIQVGAGINLEGVNRFIIAKGPNAPSQEFTVRYSDGTSQVFYAQSDTGMYDEYGNSGIYFDIAPTEDYVPIIQYNGKTIEQFDLNNGGGSDDINVLPLGNIYYSTVGENGEYYWTSGIYYDAQHANDDAHLIQVYYNGVKTTADLWCVSDPDGIDGSRFDRLEAIVRTYVDSHQKQLEVSIRDGSYFYGESQECNTGSTGYGIGRGPEFSDMTLSD
ncbi:hypothetical protein V9N52_004224 [Vibrio navarrensis]